jgi:phosphoribosyl-AMP cyclohydrolase
VTTSENFRLFEDRTSVAQVEESDQLAPKFDADGLIPCVTLHADTREVLMFAMMNREALQLTIETGLAHYWSRSRKRLWKKGESSGMVQTVRRLLIDDDQDCVVMEVSLAAPAAGGAEASCHVGYRSCFYREIPVRPDPGVPLKLTFVEQEKAFDPLAIYGDAPNPTRL